jgi:hypothetical protein
MSDQQRWFFVRDGQRQGPVEVSAVVDHILTGTLPSDVLVWHSGLPKWIAASEVDEIARELPPPIPQRPVIAPAPTLAQPDPLSTPTDSTNGTLANDSHGENRHRHRHHRNHRSRTRSHLTPVERRWLGPVLVLVALAVVGLWLLLLRLNAHP